MSETKACPTCGGTIAADAPSGACPKCMFQAGFATGGSSASAVENRVPTPEELAPKFPGLVIEELLGRGGMGVVYRARHKALDREVALKILPASAGSDRAFADRFQREARALAKLQHPNIVLVHDFGRTDDVFWIVMEYVDGTNIRQAMKAGQIGPREALAIVPQICDALQYAHEHGVVHRDIKPENVMLDKSGRVKVADFGLAKLMEHGPADASLTGVGQVMGTPHYMAPEQWEKPTTVDHRADIYSLGVVFYEMLTGELPIGRFEPPSAKVQVDVRLDEVVLRSLEKSPERRYQQVSEVRTDMGAIAAGPAAPAGRRRTAGTAYALALAVGMLTAAVFVRDLTGAARAGLSVVALGLLVASAAFWALRRRGGGRFYWRFDSEEEKARGGRLSKLAVAGALVVPLCVVLPLVAKILTFLFGGTLSIGAGEIGVLVGLVFVGWLVSIFAWVRISHSGDKLRGSAWAALGSILPVFAFCLLGPALVFTASDKGKAAMDGAGERARDVASKIDGFSEIASKWKRLLALSADAKFEDLVSLYDRSERAALETTSETERVEKARRGELGLPLLPRDRLPLPLQEYSLESVTYEEDASPPMRATATAKAGDATIRFPMSRTFEGRGQEGRLSKWDFGVGPVSIERGSYLPSTLSEEESLQVADLWRSALQRPPRPTLQDVIALYPPERADELRAMSGAHLEIDGRAGRLGLPLMPADALPDATKIRVERVDVDMKRRGYHATLVATDGARTLQVPLVASGSARLRTWTFDLAQVVLE